MRFNQPLNDLLGQQSKIKLLRALIDSDVEMSGREAARAVDLTQRIAHSALMEMRRQGVVSMRRVGRAKLYKINKENLFVLEAILPFFAFEGKLKKRLVALINRRLKNQVVSAAIFGSVATGKERPDSDIDLLLIVNDQVNMKKMEAALDELNAVISVKFGNFLAPVILREKDFRLRYGRKDKFIRNIAAKGEIVFGKTFMEMVYA